MVCDSRRFTYCGITIRTTDLRCLGNDTLEFFLGSPRPSLNTGERSVSRPQREAKILGLRHEPGRGIIRRQIKRTALSQTGCEGD
jgi:hypothetical protein